jgi:hypothetical protein
MARLEREGRMQPSGREQVEAAKRNGRWDQAYDSPANSEVPEVLRCIVVSAAIGCIGFTLSMVVRPAQECPDLRVPLGNGPAAGRDVGQHASVQVVVASAEEDGPVYANSQ